MKLPGAALCSTGACSKNGGGSTGGFSEYFGPPGFQAGMGFSKRSVPDMALDSFYGHDVYVYFFRF